MSHAAKGPTKINRYKNYGQDEHPEIRVVERAMGWLVAVEKKLTRSEVVM